MAARPAPVGIIANPASGKDIRRLVGQASVIDNNEKVRIVRRILLALDAGGVRHVLAMRDYFGIVARAAAEVRLDLTVNLLDLEWTGSEADSTAAARAMEAAGVAVLITLGGDGTNRAAAMGTTTLPFIAISTGTNNVFPTAMEGTTAGLAAAAIATGLVASAEVAASAKRLAVHGPGERSSLALVDVALLDPGFIGARAVWQPDQIRRVLLTRSSPAAMGLAGLGGLMHAVSAEDDWGLDITFDGGPGVRLLAPLAPGLFAPVVVSHCELLLAGVPVLLYGPCLLALDGERGIDVAAGATVTVTLDRAGPPVVDVEECLSRAARRGLLRDTG